MGSKNVALHVGIDDYRGVDPTGGEDLRGAVHDAQRWARFSATLGADATVLLDAQVTREGLLAALRAIGTAVADRGGSGLVTFSGHGAALPSVGTTGLGRSMALCPSDARRDGGTIAGLVSLAEVDEALGRGAADTTIAVDACYTRTDGGHPGRRSRGLSPLPPDDFGDLASRIVLAAEPWAPSYEFRAGEHWHGALSFTLLELLDQWQVRGDDVRWLDVSYADLVFRARWQLEVLGVDQRPLMVGPARNGLVPFLRPGRGLAQGVTRPRPDAPRIGAQLSADTGPNATSGYRVYSLSAVTSAGDTVVLANAVVPGCTSGYLTATDSKGHALRFYAGNEYWWFPDIAASLLFGAGVSVTSYKLAVVLSTSGTSTYATDPATKDLAGTADWVNLNTHPPAVRRGISGDYPDATAPTGTGLLQRQARNGTGAAAALQVKMTGESGTVSVQKIYWFSSTTGTIADGLFTSGGTTTFDGGTTIGSGWGRLTQTYA